MSEKCIFGTITHKSLTNTILNRLEDEYGDRYKLIEISTSTYDDLLRSFPISRVAEIAFERKMYETIVFELTLLEEEIERIIDGAMYMLP